jgi:hypothetical protein
VAVVSGLVYIAQKKLRSRKSRQDNDGEQRHP